MVTPLRRVRGRPAHVCRCAAASAARIHSEAVARLQPDHLAQLDTEGFVVVERYIDSTTVEEATAELGQIHAGLPLAGASAAREGRPLFKANAQDSQVRDDLICWLSAEDAEAWGCPALGDIARSVLGVIKPIEGPRGHYVAHRDGVPRDMCADTVAAAKQQMHDLVKAGDWAYSGSLIPFMKDAGAAMKTQHESKHARREVTAICYLNPDDWEAERDGGTLRLYPGCRPDDETGVTATTHVDVLPGRGTLVLFNSRTMLHEVRPTRRPRHALSAWLERRHNGRPDTG